MQKSNVFQFILIAALIGAAFYIGSLNARITTLQRPSQGNSTEKVSEDDTNVVDTTSLSDLAEKIGLKKDDFNTCTKSSEAQKQLSDLQSGGSNAGVTGTPGVFLLDNQTGNIAVAPGAVPLTTLQAMFDKLNSGISEEDKKSSGANQVYYTDKSKKNLSPLNDGDFVRGDKNARFSLIEYSDYDCPYCKMFHTTAQQFLKNNEGKVAWTYRQFPLDQLHPTATAKSLAALCAAKLGGNDAFWKYSDSLMNQNGEE